MAQQLEDGTGKPPAGTESWPHLWLVSGVRCSRGQGLYGVGLSHDEMVQAGIWVLMLAGPVCGHRHLL